MMFYDPAIEAQKAENLLKIKARLAEFKLPIYASLFNLLDTHDYGNIKVPRYQKLNLYQIVNVVGGFKDFRRNVDAHAANQEEPVGRCDMDAAWFQMCLRKYAKYDSRAQAERAGEDVTAYKQKVLSQGIEQLRNDDAEDYWKAKGQKFPWLDVEGFPIDSDDDHAPAEYHPITGFFIRALYPNGEDSDRYSDEDYYADLYSKDDEWDEDDEQHDVEMGGDDEMEDVPAEDEQHMSHLEQGISRIQVAENAMQE